MNLLDMVKFHTSIRHIIKKLRIGQIFFKFHKLIRHILKSLGTKLII